jgi:hypothetical protein
MRATEFAITERGPGLCTSPCAVCGFEGFFHPQEHDLFRCETDFDRFYASQITVHSLSLPFGLKSNVTDPASFLTKTTSMRPSLSSTEPFSIE